MTSEETAAPAPPEPPDKAALLRLIDETRATYEAALAAIGDQEAPLRDNGRSARDIAGHVAVWERRLAHDIQTSLRSETPERPELGYTWDQMDELNVRDMLAARALSLTEAQAEARAAFAETRAGGLAQRRDALHAGTLRLDRGRAARALGALRHVFDMWERYQERTVDLEQRRS